MADNKKIIEKWVNEIFIRYRQKTGNVTLPIDENILLTIIEELEKIKIELEEKEEKTFAHIDEGILIPRKKGFILRYGLNPYKGEEKIFNLVARKRFTICHELSHILFYDCNHIIPKLSITPQEHICHEITRNLLLPMEAVKKKIDTEHNPNIKLIPFLREFSRYAKVSLYPLIIRLTEDLSLLKDSLITFWEYIGDSFQSELSYKNFRPDSKMCPELRKYLPYYWRHRIYIKVWNEAIKEVANDRVPLWKKSLSIEGKKRRKDKIKYILFDLECEPLVELSNQQFPPKWINQTSLYDVLSVEKFNLSILEKGK